jgi:hypothetical protein
MRSPYGGNLPDRSIPRFSVWEGETLSFKVTCTFSDRADFTILTVSPTPKGPLSLDRKSGQFTFRPSPEDKEFRDQLTWEVPTNRERHVEGIKVLRKKTFTVELA